MEISPEDKTINWVFNKIDILKVDVEGNALDVFKGASNCIKKIDKIVLEAHTKEEMEIGSFLQPDFEQLPSKDKCILYFKNKNVRK